jgi:hypothetical protein
MKSAVLTRSVSLQLLTTDQRQTTNDYFFTATATPSRIGRIVVNRSGEL